MKRLFLLFSTALLVSFGGAPEQSSSDMDYILDCIHNPSSRQVLVASHRGDWRNFPENSLPGIRSAIEMGVDIIELDLQMTKDSVLVLCHDRSIDRTTTGRGLVSEITYDSIRRVKLRAGHNVATQWDMPTFEEALEVCKDRAVVNIDKGCDYYDLVHAALVKHGMLHQALIKGRLKYAKAEALFAPYEENCLFMPIVNFSRKGSREVFDSYIDRPVPPLAYEMCWSELTPEVEAEMKRVVDSGAKLWVNSLWPALCGEYNDDRAVQGETDAAYGRLVDLGASFIQTDRPQLLLEYLRERGLHR